MLSSYIMNNFLKIMSIFILLNTTTSVFAVETTNKIEIKSENILKTLTRKSLSKQELLQFLFEYVIIIDDEKGNGIVTYYFKDDIYTRYKNLEIISEDKWLITRLGYLLIFDNNKKNFWKIQPSKENKINIKKSIASIGKVHNFAYKNKTDYYLKLEKKKINDRKK